MAGSRRARGNTFPVEVADQKWWRLHEEVFDDALADAFTPYRRGEPDHLELSTQLPDAKTIEVPTQRGRDAASRTTSEDRLTISVEGAAQLLGISRSLAYDAVARGEIPSIRIGRRILVPKEMLHRMLSPTERGD